MNLWKPVGGSHLYCSAHCQAGCTKADFDWATEQAAQLAKDLGPGWKPEVWENRGWFARATRGVAEVHVHRNASGENTYSAYINTNPQFVELHSAHPRLALGIALSELDDHITTLKEQRAEIAPWSVDA